MDKLSKQAFTLVELLVVIAIVGILSGLIIVGMSSSVQSANIAKAKIFANSLRNSLLINLMGEWKFEGPTAIGQTATVDDAVDTWGNNNTGIIINQAPIVKGGTDCVYGKCINFNSGATDDNIVCGNGGSDLNIASGDSMTVEAWVKLDTLGSAKSIVSKWTPWIFFIDANGKLSFYIRTSGSDTSVVGNTRINLSTWYHVAVVYTKADLRATFYLNGIQNGNPTFSVSMSGPSTANVRIGGYGNSATDFTGTIDELRLYNTAIPASQIREQYYAGLNKLLLNSGISKKDYENRMDELIKDS